MDSRRRAPRKISEALRTTLELIWKESDAFTRRQLALSLLLLLTSSLLSACYPIFYRRTIDALNGQTRPLIYVFDEATSSLDSRTEREILQNLIDVARASTTIVIAHRLPTVAHADEIVVLDRGTIIERGSHAALIEARGAYAALWQAQNANGDAVSEAR